MPNKPVKCGSCEMAIGSKDKFVKCSGICDGCVYHIDCTGLKDYGSAWEKVKGVSGLKWMCEHCNKKFEEIGGDGFIYAAIKSSMEKAVATQMKKINSKLDNFIAASQAQPAGGSPLFRGNQRKRLRSDLDGDSTPKLSNTYRDKLLYGTKTNDIGNDKLKGVSQPAKELGKGIYLSQLDPKTETKDVIDYLIDNKLVENDSAIKCVKLVSPKAVCDSFTYVSFKLEVPDDLYGKLITPDVWPTSVAVREFVNKPRPSIATASFSKN